MDRQLIWRVAMAAACLATAGLGAAGAQTPRTPQTPQMPAARASRTVNDVTLTAAMAGGEAVVVAEMTGMRLERRTNGQNLRLVMTAGRDRVTIDADAGHARISRGVRTEKLVSSRIGAASFTAVRALLKGSKAIQGLEAMAARLADQKKAGAVVAQSALAFVGLLQGQMGPARTLQAAMRPDAPAFAVVRTMAGGEEEVFADCWDEYERSSIRFWYDLEGCHREFAWNPFMWSACNFEWTVRVELLWFSTISCAGGLPAV